MFNFIDIYSFIYVSGCIGRGHSALLCLGAYNAVKMAHVGLVITYVMHWMSMHRRT